MGARRAVYIELPPSKDLGRGLSLSLGGAREPREGRAGITTCSCRFAQDTGEKRDVRRRGENPGTSPPTLQQKRRPKPYEERKPTKKRRRPCTSKTRKKQ
eukprot:1720991-Amphidinium_carterae.1